MTKLVRIENADNSNHKLVVEVWQHQEDGDRQVETRPINNPCDMAVQMVHATQYLVVKEV